MRQISFAVAFAAVAVLVAACTDVGDCPAQAAIVPGGSCSGDSLECPFALQSLSPACDGTTVDGGIATSCVCTNGSWNCPSPVSCSGESADAGEEGTAEASDAAGEDATSDAANQDGAGEAAGDGAGDALGQ